LRTIFVATRPLRTKVTLRVTGVVLVGGKSTRFGSEKALHIINGIAMGRIVANAMFDAGIADVYALGADQSTAAILGLAHISDGFTNEGPLGALITAMSTIDCELLCVMPCDVPAINRAIITELIEAVSQDDCDGAVLISDKPHWLCSAWKVASCFDILRRQFDSGQRALHRSLEGLVVKYVQSDSNTLINVNSESDIVDLL